MSLLEALPYSLCHTGPELIDGVGNYYLQVYSSSSLQHSVLNIFLLDSHGQIPSNIKNPDYDPIKESQIQWFKETSQALREERQKDRTEGRFHVSLAFLHIPLPEFGDDDLEIRNGRRREPTEGPSNNTHFYDALVEEGVDAIGCGHDHVNNFCALLPRSDERSRRDSAYQYRPWLCYGGGSGFGGYCSYGKERYHRGTRVWKLDANKEMTKTWLRVEYAQSRVDELVLVEKGTGASSGASC
jgi:3',5'-cyclic AMP phosphodiesterase CpdA